MSHDIQHRKKSSARWFWALATVLAFALFFTSFSILVYKPTQVQTRAMDTATFRSLLVQKGIQLPSPLPASMTEAQYSQLAQFAGITTGEAKVLFNQLKAEEASGSASIATPVPTAGPTPSSSPITPSPTPVIKPATQSAVISPTPTSSPAGSTSQPGAVLTTEAGTTDESLREGELYPFHEDHLDTGESIMRYYLHKDGKSIELEPSSALEKLAPRTYLKISNGTVVAGRLQTVSSTGISLIQTVRVMDPKIVSPNLVVTGSRKAALILLNFPTSSFTSPTKAGAQAHLDGQLKDFMLETSYGKLNFTGDVFGPYTASIPATCDVGLYSHEAVRLADAVADFTKYTHVMVVVPNVCNYGGIGALGWQDSYTTNEGTVWMYETGYRADNFSLRTTSHELGHNFGGYHSNGWECGSAVTGTSCSTIEYADQWEPLGGNKAFHYSGYHKNLFGWMVASNTITTTTSGTYTIKAIELNTTQPQILRVKNPLTPWYYYIEARNPTGFDATLPQGVTQGALIRVAPLINGCGATCSDTHIVDRLPGSAAGSADFADAYWPVGTAMVDQGARLSITPTARTGDDLTVKVIFMNDQPALNSPVHGAVTETLFPTFSWNSVPNADQYTIQASLTSAFSTYLINQTIGQTEYTPTTALPAGRVIYWKVTPKAGALSGLSSVVENFTSASPPSVPVLSTPVTNTLSQSDTVKLTWRASSGTPATYHVQVSTTTGADFDSGIVYEDPAVSAPTITVTTSALPRVATYYWRVRSSNANGHLSGWSAVWNFKVAPAIPELLTPVPGESGFLSPYVELSWTFVDGATNYYLQISRNNTFTSLIYNQAIGSANNVFTTPALPEGVNIYWRVYAVSPVGNSSYSASSYFVSSNPPSVPVLKTPVTNTLSQSTTVKLDWNASTVPTPDHYEVQVSTKTGTDFASGIVDSNANVVGLTFTTKALPRVATYYWRVRAIGVDGTTSAWSAIWIFKIAPDVPVLVSPADGATNILTPTPILDWNDVPGATNYYIQVARNATFGTLVVNKLTGSAISSFTTPALTEGVPIYWRVYAVSAVGNGTYSAVRSFTSSNPPSTPVLKTPATNTLSQTDTVKLDWNASTVPTPAKYEIQVSTKTGVDFDSGIVDSNANVVGLTFTTKALPRFTTYYWRVRAIGTDNAVSAWSAIWIFKIAPAVPVLVSPVNGATNILTLTPKLDWNDVPGATNYYIQVARNATFGTLVVNKLTGSTVSEFVTPALVEGVPIYWRVYAVSAVGNSSYSTVYSFTSANPPSSPVLKTPATNTLSQTDTVKLDWNASTAPTPDHYEIQVSTQTGTAFDTGIVDSNTNVTGLTFTTKVLPRVATYYWRVRAIGADGAVSAWSAIWIFKIAPAVPVLVSPTNGATNILVGTPTFDWADVTGATSYYFQMSLYANFSTLLQTQATTTISTYTPTTALTEGKLVYWRVVASSAVGNSSPSAPFTLTSADFPTRPAPSTPADSFLSPTNTPTFTWTASTAPVPDHYEFQIQSPDGVTIVQSANVPGNLTSYTATALGKGLGFYWRVRAVAPTGTMSDWSIKRYIKIKSDTPSLVAPTNGSSIHVMRPKFDWTDVANATGYYIQVSKNSTFTSLVVNKLTNSTLSEYTSDVDLPVGTTVYWRVYATSVAGNSDWSPYFSLLTANPPPVPTPQTPTNGGNTYTLTPSFSWTTSALASKYRIQISTKTGVDFDSGIVTDNANITTLPYTASALSRTNPTYYWRVRGENSFSEVSNWSPIWSVNLKLTPTVTSSQKWNMTSASATQTFNYPFVGDNKFMLVGVSYFYDRFATIPRIKAMSYGNVQLLRVNRAQAGDYGTEMWYLPVNAVPTNSTLQVVEEYADASGSVQVTAVTFSGVNQTTPLRSVTGVVNSNDPGSYGGAHYDHTLDVPSANGETVFAVHTQYSGNFATVTAKAGMTTHQSGTYTNSVTTVSSKPSTTSTTQMAWTTSYEWPWSTVGVSLKGF